MIGLSQIEFVSRGVAALQGSAAMQDLLVRGVLLLAVVTGLAAVVLFARRLLTRRSEQSPGLTLEGLDEMRNSGQVSPEEYRVLRLKILGLSVPGIGMSSQSSASDSSPGGLPAGESSGVLAPAEIEASSPVLQEPPRALERGEPPAPDSGPLEAPGNESSLRSGDFSSGSDSSCSGTSSPD